MERAIAQFTLEDGTPFLVEIDEPEGSAIQRVAAVNTGQLVYQAKVTLEEALDRVKPVAATVLTKLKSGLTTPADEIEVTFGLKLNAAAGVVFSSVGGEVTFEVKLKWHHQNATPSVLPPPQT
jgi:Trypsin-co-occurring domain 1